MTVAVRRDPPLRKDDRCAHCRKPRKHAVASRYSGDQAVRDPFCSAVCARAWHKVAIPKGPLT